MKRQLSVTSRQELMDSLRARYRSGSRVEKCRILDEFVAVTGYHRKHAIPLLKLGRVARPAVARARPRRYGNAVAEALVVLWEASDRVCGKRLKALIPTLLDALERHGHLQLDRDVRVQVLSASAATIDRLLVLPRSGSPPRRRRRSGPTTTIRQSVPVRTFADWGEPVPGFVEADLVAHSGERASGSFAQTLRSRTWRVAGLNVWRSSSEMGRSSRKRSRSCAGSCPSSCVAWIRTTAANS